MIWVFVHNMPQTCAQRRVAKKTTPSREPKEVAKDYRTQWNKSTACSAALQIPWTSIILTPSCGAHLFRHHIFAEKTHLHNKTVKFNGMNLHDIIMMRHCYIFAHKPRCESGLFYIIYIYIYKADPFHHPPPTDAYPRSRSSLLFFSLPWRANHATNAEDQNANVKFPLLATLGATWKASFKASLKARSSEGVKSTYFFFQSQSLIEKGVEDKGIQQI